MKLSIFLSVVSLSALAVVHGAPTNQVKASAATAAAAAGKVQSATGPLSEALLGSSSTSAKPSASVDSHGNMQEDLNSRRARMMNYFGYYPGYFGAPPAAAQSPQAAFMAPYSQYNDFYQFPYGTIAPVYSYNGLLGGEGDDSYENDETQSTANEVDSNENDYEEDIFSRANRRRPGKGTGNRNSPIFYIRLPPTPYMFIRGLGYISNPPTIQPLPSPVNPFNFNPNPYQNPYMGNPYMQQPPPPPNPFINLPVNYMSNAKPVGVYQYQNGYQQSAAASAAAAAGPAMRFPINGYGPNQVTPIRQRPFASAVGPASNAYGNPDSKITHLKGPFIFNGRPEDIYLLQNLQTTPYNANYFHGYY